ncbi:hypothetical protein, partial [Paenibacillus larvae]|uniref:hypothetical protein n=1 Tax=Paenibacillus larvae TaxID=1464 RepID=UPI0039FDC9C3
SGTAQEIPVGRQGLIKLTSGLAEGDTASVQINLELETGFKWIASQGESDRVMVLVPGEGQAGSVQDNGQAGNGQTGSNQGEANLTVRTVV